MSNTPRLAPEDQFPKDAIRESVTVQPPVSEVFSGGTFTLFLATAADNILAWGVDTAKRDYQLRQFWPTEPYLAGGIVNVAGRNASLDWEIKSSSEKLSQAVTDMLRTALAGDKIGWLDFVKKFSIDLYTTDNGAFIELIRDPGMDANSKFKDERAPVIGINHLDSNRCVRTGNAQTPVLYRDRDEKLHKLKWYEVIPFSDFPSPIEKMNGVGYSSLTRALRLAQIMRSLLIYKDEKISGRNPKDLHIVGGVSSKSIEDALKRTQEGASNRGNMRFIENVVLASLDPEKPVSVATVELASLPDGFSFDQDMQWYIAGLALNFGVDYQEFAPLPGGQIGSASQGMLLSRKSSAKGPRNWMDAVVEGFTNYGVLPRNTKMIFNDKNEQEEMERQEIRTGAAEEAAILANSKIFPPEVIAKSLIRRGIYDQEDFDNTPPEWWKKVMETNSGETNKQPVGSRGGNTVGEDASRVDSNKPKPRVGDRLRKMFSNQSEQKVADSDSIQIVIKQEAAPPQDISVFTNAVQELGKAISKAIGSLSFNVNNNVSPTPVKNEINVSPTPVDVKPQFTVEFPKRVKKKTRIIYDDYGKPVGVEEE